MKKSLVCFLFLTTLHGASEPENVSSCGEVPFARRLTLRHIEGRGVGYNQGYTTLEGFLIPEEPWGDGWLPFLDVRGHLFNNGWPAANAGIGVRYLASRVWGMNGYYDYRETSRQKYNQVSMGLESLGRIWDFRINGYLPVGTTKSSYFDAKFDKFQTHYMIIKQKREFAMKGANAEVGVHVDRFKYKSFYFAAGPYYLRGEGRTAWGGELRAALDILSYARVEGSASYDNLFKWIGQGQISFILPIGKQDKRGATCTIARGYQRVGRSEIIPLDRKRKHSKAINPATGQPYFFWFVNNTSHSQGTYESPFNMLLDAQHASSPNDVIYVFPGDGTSKGLNKGMRLKDNQKFFGAGVSQRLATTAGVITIPPQAIGMPMIINQSFAPPATILCANNNEISGFQLFVGGFNTAISCSSFNNVSIHNNSISASTFANGVDISGFTGTATIFDNAFILLDIDAVGLRISPSSVPATYVVTGNQFFERLGALHVTAIAIASNVGANGGTFVIAQNQFTNCSTALNSVFFNYNSSMVFSQNILTNCGEIGTSYAFFGVDGTSGASLNAQVIGNVFQHSHIVTNTLQIEAVSNGNMCVIMKDNTSDLPFLLINSSTGTFTVEASNNVPSFTSMGSITPGICP